MLFCEYVCFVWVLGLVICGCWFVFGCVNSVVVAMRCDLFGVLICLLVGFVCACFVCLIVLLLLLITPLMFCFACLLVISLLFVFVLWLDLFWGL